MALVKAFLFKSVNNVVIFYILCDVAVGTAGKQDKGGRPISLFLAISCFRVKKTVGNANATGNL